MISPRWGGGGGGDFLKVFIFWGVFGVKRQKNMSVSLRISETVL